MLKKILATKVALASFGFALAQDTTKKSLPINLSGSVDAYYRYNFSDPPSGVTNSYTSFTKSNNSFELGMASIKADHSFGKVSATADLGFGRRAEDFSYNDASHPTLFAVKQLFVTYAASDKVKFTLGKWATHVGYELVDAYGNRNYSMSYLFSYGPFFHTGVKADIAIKGKTALMVGIANPTDQSTTVSSTKVAIAQLSTATKDDKLKAYLNYQGFSTPDVKVNQFDLVLMGTLSSKFSVNYDGSIFSTKVAGASANWWGSALYFNYDPKDKYGFTLRGEYFDDKKNVAGIGSDVLAFTLSANIKVDHLTIIPEIRYDNASKAEIFTKADGTTTKSTASALLAVVYKF